MNRLHLCCGDVYLEDYINIDTYGVLVSSVSDNPNKTTIDKYYKNELCEPKLPIIDRQMNLPNEWDYPENNLDEVLMICAIEHFAKNDAIKLIKYINLSLKLGGKFRFDFPDILNTIYQYCDRPDYMIRLIYGSGKNEWAYHKYGYTKKTIVELLNLYPWSIIEFKDIVNHEYPMTGVEATK